MAVLDRTSPHVAVIPTPTVRTLPEHPHNPEAVLPTYVYRCEQCGASIERRQRFQDAPLTECEACRGELRRVLQPVSVIFKGSGFYSTDYKNSGAAAATEGKAESTTTSASADESDGGSKPTATADSAKTSAPAATASPSKTD